METKEVKKNQPGNKTTELIIGAASMKFDSSLRGLLSVVPEIQKLTTVIQDGTLQVTDLEDKIGGLKQDLENKKAQNKIELQQAFDTNQRTFIDKWMTDNKMVFLPSDELQKLKTDLLYATDKVGEQVQKAVGAATNNLKTEHINEIKLAKLEHEKSQANNLAELVQLKNQIKFLEAQCADWKNQCSSQMTAETERAKYGAVGTINVGDQTGKR